MSDLILIYIILGILGIILLCVLSMLCVLKFHLGCSGSEIKESPNTSISSDIEFRESEITEDILAQENAE